MAQADSENVPGEGRNQTAAVSPNQSFPLSVHSIESRKGAAFRITLFPSRKEGQVDGMGRPIYLYLSVVKCSHVCAATDKKKVTAHIAL